VISSSTCAASFRRPRRARKYGLSGREPAPGPVAANLFEEEPGEPGGQKKADGPEEVEDDEEAAALLRRQVLGEHGRVDDEHSAEAEAGEEAEGRERAGPPRERRERGESRVPEDRRLEDAPPADAVGDLAENEAPEERPGERRGGDPASVAPGQAPEAGEDGDGEPDEQDLHRHKGPRGAGDCHRLAVKAGEPAGAEHILHVDGAARAACLLHDCHDRPVCV
jgi:hypothetical protein